MAETKYVSYNIILQFIKNRRILEYVLGKKYFHTSDSYSMPQQNGYGVVITTLRTDGILCTTERAVLHLQPMSK